MHAPPRFLAIETSTDALSVALGSGEPGAPEWAVDGPGGAQASTGLLPTVRTLLAQAGATLAGLDAIVFGQGPGAFTGLRTACAVAQGLAHGSRSARHPEGLPVLPVGTLLALAEQARADHGADGQAAPAHIVAVLDARMGELYVAAHRCQGSRLQPLGPARLCSPGDLAPWLADLGLARADTLLAGNAFDSHADALAALPGMHRHALPTARALLRLAPDLLQAGAAVAARDALPLYVRDKVARTTAEREQAA